MVSNESSFSIEHRDLGPVGSTAGEISRSSHTQRPRKAPNFENRTLWIDDNINVLREIDDGTVDLIYLDPPFNSKRMYHAPLGSEASEAQFDDIWTLDSVKKEWTSVQEHADAGLWHTLQGTLLSAGESMQAYLVFMTPRLLEMHRILRNTGSLFLHCDPHASHYLKGLLDYIFGQNKFRNEIVWKRTSTKSLNQKRFARNGDRIMYYSKSADFTWNQEYQGQSKEYIESNFRFDDEDGLGPWSSSDLTGGKAGGKEAYLPFKGALPSPGRAWAPPRRERFPAEIAEALPANYEDMNQLEKCHALDEVGAIHWTASGSPRVKRYLSAMPGLPASDIVVDIAPVGATSAERTGWPTQKPLKLLQYLIRVSSNVGDWVLDPFAGCATTCVAAELEGRRWAGIDIDEVAVGVTLKRLQDHADAAAHNVNLTGLRGGLPQVHLPPNPPTRTDEFRPKRTPNSRLREILWQQLPDAEDGERRACPACRKYKYKEDFHLDHIQARSKGGPDIDDNIQLLCGSCNAIKGSVKTMQELREDLLARDLYSQGEVGLGL